MKYSVAKLGSESFCEGTRAGRDNGSCIWIKSPRGHTADFWHRTGKRFTNRLLGPPPPEQAD